MDLQEHLRMMERQNLITAAGAVAPDTAVGGVPARFIRRIDE